MQQFGVQMPHRPIPMEHFPRPLCTVSPNKINKLLCETVLEQGMVSTPPENGEFGCSDECNDLAAALSVSIIDTFGRKHSRGSDV